LVVLGLLAAAFMTGAQAQYCKWVDETGCVHYAKKCPPGVEAEKLEIQEKPCPDDIKAVPPKIFAAGSEEELPDEVLQKAIEQSSFEPVTSTRQLAGCWEKIQAPADVKPNPNKIEIYPFEEPRHQYFCFESAGKLYTFMTTRKPDYSPRELKKHATLLPSVERYSIPRDGIVQIKHLDAGTSLFWVTSVANVVGAEELYGMRSGDLLMTIRNTKTGEDLYFRHLRKID
jgi:hypothetical protein